MTKMEVTRQALQEKINRKNEYIKNLIENIRDYGERAVILMDDDMDWALGKIETIGRLTKEIEQERQAIREIRQQIRLIEFLMKEGE